MNINYSLLPILPPKLNKMKRWLLIYYFTIFIFLINKIGTVNKKLPKSFDEIFGKGWEEKEQKAEEKLEYGLRGDQRDGIGQCQTKVTQSDQNNYLDQINEKPTDQNENRHENGDQNINDQQKREIIQKFYAIKEKIKQREIKCTNKERSKIECAIAKKLGTNREYIYRCIKEFGMGKRKNNSNDYSDQQKRAILRKFDEIKEKLKERGIKFSRKEKGKIERAIAKKLGTYQNYIYKWKREFGMNRKQIRYKNEQKLKIIKQCWEMKRKNPKISDRKIAKILQIDGRNIRRWKVVFKKKY